LSSVKKKGGVLPCFFNVDIQDQGWLNLYFVSYVPKYGTFLNAHLLTLWPFYIENPIQAMAMTRQQCTFCVNEVFDIFP
jgi:hypothetical protein